MKLQARKTSAFARSEHSNFCWLNVINADKADWAQGRVRADCGPSLHPRRKAASARAYFHWSESYLERSARSQDAKRSLPMASA